MQTKSTGSAEEEFGECGGRVRGVLRKHTGSAEEGYEKGSFPFFFKVSTAG